jgi:hypothetical protein
MVGWSHDFRMIESGNGDIDFVCIGSLIKVNPLPHAPQNERMHPAHAISTGFPS